MQAWAVVDYLCAERAEELARFLFLLKAPFHGRLRTPTSEELERCQTESFEAAFGGAVADVDATWRAFAAKKRYPKRRRR